MIELLAPAGDFECLQSAVLYGADAVYLGGNEFGMRASPKNFTDDELCRGVEFAHQHGVKVYLTCNTIPTNEEAEAFPQFIKKAASSKIDAVIVADFGVLEAVKEHAPNLEIHMSTQVGITNYAAAKAMGKYGAKRVVLAREVDLESIRRIRQELPSDMEIEAFVHGAMCVSFSGRCLLSTYLVGRDANRGACAQPCRWGYHLMEEKRTDTFFPVFEDESGTFILNSKDLCMIEHLDKLIDVGVNSFKIEGRAKSAYYVAMVTNAYRAALDAATSGKTPPEWSIREVDNVSHRAYSTGFFFQGDNGEQYIEDSGYTRGYDFVGVVNSSVDGKLMISQRNYFTINDDIEIIAPKCAPQKIKIASLTNKDNQQIEIANKAGEALVLDCGIVFPPHSFIRRKKLG